MKLKAVIIDDEKMARGLLQNMLETLETEVVETCADLPSGVKAIRKYKPDIVFLDIEMPGLSGLELIDFFDAAEIDFGIIFTTAYHQYAVQAFKLSAVDYLLKPFTLEELQISIDKFIKQHKHVGQLHLLKEHLSEIKTNRIAINTTGSVRFIDVNDITCLKADGAYTQLSFINQTQLLSSKGLKHFEEILTPYTQFFRCHKSCIVNVNTVTEYVKSDGGHLVLKTGMQVSLSPDKVDDFLAKAH